MATYNKFNQTIADAFNGAHDFDNDTYKVMLTNVAPIASNSIKADITEIAAGNGYTAGGDAITIGAAGQTGGTYSAPMTGDIVFTASGGAIADFRYVVIYNDTQTTPAKPLVSWYDYGSTLSVADAETFTVKTNAINLFTAS
jgi:hypothetical protein